MMEATMMTTVRAAFSALVLLGFWIAMDSIADDKAGVDARAAFARLKTLEGQWKVASDGNHDGAKIIYKVTAAGSALMETSFPGTDHEMITMYHLDGDDLRMTHYCAAGNQPRLKLDREASKPDLYSFVFDGGTNLNPAKDMHIHSLRIKFLDGGKVEADWEGYMDGKACHATKFALSRP
jgi:hypothetical protein